MVMASYDIGGSAAFYTSVPNTFFGGDRNDSNVFIFFKKGGLSAGGFKLPLLDLLTSLDL